MDNTFAEATRLGYKCEGLGNSWILIVLGAAYTLLSSLQVPVSSQLYCALNACILPMHPEPLGQAQGRFVATSRFHTCMSTHLNELSHKACWTTTQKRIPPSLTSSQLGKAHSKLLDLPQPSSPMYPFSATCIGHAPAQNLLLDVAYKQTIPPNMVRASLTKQLQLASALACPQEI